MLPLEIRSVNVSLPRVIGTVAGAAVSSGIDKRPVTADELRLRHEQLEGDGQADRSVHGGPDKAVYVYPSEHWPAWERQHGLACVPGTFGENLTLAGATESEIHIGDVFAWGEALLEVSQPRQPCFKLGLHLGRADIAPALVKSARSGWYLRVRRPGQVPVRGAHLEPVDCDDARPSVHTLFVSYFDPKATAAELAALAATPALADAWRAGLLHRAAVRR